MATEIKRLKRSTQAQKCAHSNLNFFQNIYGIIMAWYEEKSERKIYIGTSNQLNILLSFSINSRPIRPVETYVAILKRRAQVDGRFYWS